MRLKDRVFTNVVKFEERYIVKEETSFAFLNRLENKRVSFKNWIICLDFFKFFVLKFLINSNDCLPIEIFAIDLGNGNENISVYIESESIESETVNETISTSSNHSNYLKTTF